MEYDKYGKTMKIFDDQKFLGLMGSIQPVSPEMKVCHIGPGIMGSRIARNIHKYGYFLNPIGVYARKQESTGEISDNSKEFFRNYPQFHQVDSIEDMVLNYDIITICVGDDNDLQEIIIYDDGILSFVRQYKKKLIIIDFSTISPYIAQRIYKRVMKYKCKYIGAPVSGSKPRAENSTLDIAPGGGLEEIAYLLPIFESIGEIIVPFEKIEEGYTTKILHNVNFAMHLIGTCETKFGIHKNNLDFYKVSYFIKYGAAGCWVNDYLGPKIAIEDYEADFKAIHLLKDLKIASSIFPKDTIPGLELSIFIFQQLVSEQLSKQNNQELGVQALYKIYAEERIKNIKFNFSTK